MKNKPKRIYLQVGEDNGDEDFNGLSEVTWSKDRVYDSDIEYVLSDEYLEENLRKIILENEGDRDDIYSDVVDFIKEIR